MRIALRLAAGCAILFGVLWPTAALSDEATLKRTAPDDCIAWFSWAGLDALAKGGDKSNRTEQLLADEEVRALFDSIAKSIKVASQSGAEEETQLTIKLFDTISKRPAVGFLTKIAQVKQDAPPKASEPVVLPPATATIVPTTKITVGTDGLERIGVDFDVQVTASDAPQQKTGSAKPQAAASANVGPKVGRTRTVGEKGHERREVELIWPNKTEWHEFGTDVEFGANGEIKSSSSRELNKAEIESLVADIPEPEFSFGRSRTTVVDGKQCKEVELIGPNGAEWIGVDFDFDLNDKNPSKCSVADRMFDAMYDLPAVGTCMRAVDTAIWVSQQSSGSSQPAETQANPPATIELEDGRIAVPFDFDLEPAKPEGMPQTSAGLNAVHKQLSAKLHDGFQAGAVPVAPVTLAPSVATDTTVDTPQLETGPQFSEGGFRAKSPESKNAVAIFDASAQPAKPGSESAPPVCTTCQGCQTCQAAAESTFTKTVYHGAIVADLGPCAADAKAYYDKMESQGEKLPREKIADVEFMRLDMDQPLWLAFHEAYAIVAFDKASAEQVLLGLAGKREIPKWLVDAEAKLPVERPAARIHINIDSIAKLVDEPFEAPSQELVKSLGLDQVSAISFVAGLDDHGTAVKTLIATRDGANVSAVLDIFGDKGLAADDLKVIPKDSTFAAAGKLDISKLFNLGLKLATIDDQGAGDAWEETKKHLAEQLFIDFSKDILAALGETWTVHSSPSEGGLMATTFTLAVRDEAKLKSVIEKLAVLANSGEKVISRFKYRDQEVYYVNHPDEGYFLSWCIKDGRLVASMLPQTIKAHIARGPVKESLAEVSAVAQAIELGETGRGIVDGKLVTHSRLYVLTYTDTPAILRWCYQYGSFLLPTIGVGLNEMTSGDGPKFELHEIPSLAVIEHYFEPSITTFSRTDHGLLFDSRQTVPMMSSLFGLTAFSTVGGAAIDGTDLSNFVEMAASVAELPIGIATGGGGIVGTARSGDWHQDDIQYYPVPPDMPPPHPPASQPGPWIQPPAYPAPAPAGTPVPYAPSIPGHPYLPPPAMPPAAAPSYSTGAPPVAMPQVNSGYVAPGYAAPAKTLPMPAAPNVPLSVPAGLAPPIAATYAEPNATAYPAPVTSPPAVPEVSYDPSPKPIQGPHKINLPPPAKLPLVYTNPPNTPYPPKSSAKSEAPQHNPPAAKPAKETKPAAEAELEPNTRQSRRLFRRRAAASQSQGKNHATNIAKASPAVDLRLTDQAPAKTVAASASATTPAVLPKPNPLDYIIEAPDIVSIDLLDATSKEPQPVRPGDRFLLIAWGTSYLKPLDGWYTVDAKGLLQLGPTYGAVKVDGLTHSEVYTVASERLRSISQNAAIHVYGYEEYAVLQEIGGEHLVSLNGSIQLGTYGSVSVAGLTIEQAEAKIQQYLATTPADVTLTLSVFGYHSKSFHVDIEDPAEGHNVKCVPYTGKMTALEAVQNLTDLRPLKKKNIWIARQSPIAGQAEQIFPVQWPAVPKRSLLAFDHQVQPGDRIIVTDRAMPGSTMSF